MFDLRLIESFIAVAEERSFTQAAERLGLAQSAVSMRLKRLEDVVRFPLVARTSRRVTLTAEGLAFLPQARALLVAEAEARAAAQDILASHGHALRIGSYAFLSGARSRLISNYLRGTPEAEILMLSGTRDELLDLLRAGAIDLVICLSSAEGGEGGEGEDVVVRQVSRLYAHLVVPPGDTLFDAEGVALASLARRQVTVMPNRIDRKGLGRLTELMLAHRIRLVAGPDAEKETTDAFALARGLPHLAWYAKRRPRHLRDGWAVLPIEDVGMSVELVVLTSATGRRAECDAFLEKVAWPRLEPA